MNARMGGLAALLAFVAFLIWVVYVPHAAGVNQQQMVVTGCCCGTRDGATPIVADATPPAPHHAAATPRRIQHPDPHALALTQPWSPALAAPAITAPDFIAPITPVQAFDAPRYGGGIVQVPRVSVAEPPAWPLAVLGALAVLGFAWAARRERDTDTHSQPEDK